METVVIIVGAGPSGLANSACLSKLSIPHIIFEKEDVYAPLWNKRSYDRLKLHLAKEFCSLPYAAFPKKTPTYLPKGYFISYLEAYVKNFNIKALYNHAVESCYYDRAAKKWRVQVKDVKMRCVKVYACEFLVIAAGENGARFVPNLPGLNQFGGEILHSSEYKSGSKFFGEKVLVVGCGNSGMEIAYDLSNFGAETSIVIRSPLHVLTKEMVHLGMWLLKYLRIAVVDFIIIMIAKLYYGDTSKFGIHRPTKGPFYIKATTGRSAVIDVGTLQKIKEKEIEVLPEITNIGQNEVLFKNGIKKEFDAIIFATGYKVDVKSWLKDYNFVFNEDCTVDLKNPTYWRGKNGLYCAGFSRRGLQGVSIDALAIAKDINFRINEAQILFG